MWDWLILLLYVVILFLFLRPGSKGPALVETFTRGIVDLIKAATGGGGWWPAAGQTA